MRIAFAFAAALALLCLGGLAQANITVDTVAVGNPGNADDTLVMSDGSSGYGSVGYAYNIGKYEVTAGQYCAFLNAVAATDTHSLYNTSMDLAIDPTACNIKRSGADGSYSYSIDAEYASRPVSCVSFWDSCRFVNWLNNGQGDCDTESGAYTLTSDGITNNTVTRNAGATWAVASEDEWYKAAFYDPDKGGSGIGGYWLYATSSDTIGTSAANYDSSVGHTTDGGHYGVFGAYGTYDQCGNVWERNDTIIPGGRRGLRGGAFASASYSLPASNRYGTVGGLLATGEGTHVGFRVVMVPEPSSIVALIGGLVGLLATGRRYRIRT